MRSVWNSIDAQRCLSSDQEEGSPSSCSDVLSWVLTCCRDAAAPHLAAVLQISPWEQTPSHSTIPFSPSQLADFLIYDRIQGEHPAREP